MSAPTQEEQDDYILACRFGEVDEVKAFGDKYGWEAAAAIKDERGNTGLHMACGNGHLDVVKLFIEHAPKSIFSQVNEAGSPPVHWAVLNNHVQCVMELVLMSEERGGGLPMLKQTNGSGRDAFAEANFAGEGKEEVAGWIEGYLWKHEGGDENDGKDELPAGAKVTVADEDVPDKDSDGPVDDLAGEAAELKVQEGQ